MFANSSAMHYPVLRGEKKCKPTFVGIDASRQSGLFNVPKVIFQPRPALEKPDVVLSPFREARFFGLRSSVTTTASSDSLLLQHHRHSRLVLVVLDLLCVIDGSFLQVCSIARVDSHRGEFIAGCGFVLQRRSRNACEIDSVWRPIS